MGDFLTEFRSLLHQVEQIGDKIAKEHGVEHLAGPQGWALLYLAKCSDKEVFVKDIEKEMKISKSVASNLVKRMEKNDFIQVIPSKQDKRYKQIILTANGQEKVSRLDDFHQELHQSLFNKITKEDFQLVKQWAHQLSENIKEYKEKHNV
ncbi:MarR family transcriptional regulator [Streptococcus suis]|nr:MarR family transcriptional regulator [Streptococcus suis]